jgi:hypothetical protein
VLRVDLVLAPQPVWRRLRLSEHASFWDLHVAIQDAMGWNHRHRHLFVADHPETGARLRLGIPEAGRFHGGQAVLPGWEVAVANVIRADHPPILYTYHLGEQWQHEVCLEATEAAAVAGPVPACLDGAGQGPGDDPDGGGPPGDEPFDPETVVFCDPGRLWQDTFDPGDD